MIISLLDGRFCFMRRESNCAVTWDNAPSVYAGALEPVDLFGDGIVVESRQGPTIPGASGVLRVSDEFADHGRGNGYSPLMTWAPAVSPALDLFTSDVSLG